MTGDDDDDYGLPDDQEGLTPEEKMAFRANYGYLYRQYKSFEDSIPDPANRALKALSRECDARLEAAFPPLLQEAYDQNRGNPPDEIRFCMNTAWKTYTSWASQNAPDWADIRARGAAILEEAFLDKSWSVRVAYDVLLDAGKRVATHLMIETLQANGTSPADIDSLFGDWERLMEGHASEESDRLYVKTAPAPREPEAKVLPFKPREPHS